jgi:hypothetical protein
VLLVIGGWVAAALVTTATSIWAISLLGEGITSAVAVPVGRSDVAHALASARATGGAPSAPEPAQTSSGQDLTRGFSTEGGTVLAACDSGLATLVSWSPAQGYAADDLEPGPAAAVSMEFESDDYTVQVRVVCAGGVPAMTQRAVEDD